MRLPKLFQSFSTPIAQDRALPATVPGQSAETYGSSGWYQPYALFNGNLIPNSSTYPVISQQGLLGLPAAWACVNMIAHAGATMLASGDVYDSAGVEVPAPQAVSLPNPLYNSAYEFWHEVISTLVIYGNYVGIIYDGYVVPVHPAHVECRLSNEGFPVYRIGENVYHHEDVLHVRGLTMPGSWWGMGAIEAQRKSLAASVDMQNYASTTYTSGAVPTSVIKLESRNVTQDVLTQIGSDWQNSFGNGNRKPVVLPQGIDVHTLAWTPEDSQFLESRQFNVAEIALMFGVNPNDLTATIGGQSLTYSNIGEVNLERVKRTFAPWVIRVEQAWKKVLPSGFSFCANPEALLRMDTKSRYESYTIALAGGWLTIAEVRELEDLPPLPNEVTPPTPQEDTPL